MTKNELPIGVFDSGVGGISVLRELVKILPNENFIYFGDSLNAPYGTKTHNEIQTLTAKNVAYLVEQGVKAIVVACNTATSVCIDILRKAYPKMPVVGIEPALKPAVMHKPNSRVIVMATPLTLSEKKFLALCDKYKSDAKITHLPCPGLMELVESGKLRGAEVEKFLNGCFLNAGIDKADSVVLGCTHYPFVKSTIQKLLGNAVVFDGGEGTAKQLKRLLENEGLLNIDNLKGKIVFQNSSKDKEKIKLCKMLLTAQI